jgi:hypothetical protein
MKRAAAPLILLLALVVTPSALSRSSTNSIPPDERIDFVVPAIRDYFHSKHSYAKMTVRVLRHRVAVEHLDWRIRIVWAKKRSYCVESTAGSPQAFRVGPGGEILAGSCRDPRNGKPYDLPPAWASQPDANQEDAMQIVSVATADIGAYYQDHNTYKGATAAQLREEYDPMIGNLKVVSASKTSYCIESEVGGSYAFRNGSSSSPELGRCPRG